MNHLFLKCAYAKGIWETSGLGLSHKMDFSAPFRYYLLHAVVVVGFCAILYTRNQLRLRDVQIALDHSLAFVWQVCQYDEQVVVGYDE